MRIIISPAKKMREDRDSLPVQGLPAYLQQTRRLLHTMRQMSERELQALWKCNDQITRLNLLRLADMDLERALTPALLSYEGIQYQYMGPRVLEQGALDYLQQHLRILSGFYGLLRPMDGVTPYRLEMGAKLSVDGGRDLYGFWGSQLAETLAGETDVVLNLASKEYSRAVQPHLPKGVHFVSCTFGEEQGGKVVEKGTMCKMARGEMVRWLAENRIQSLRQIAQFDGLGYQFSKAHSDENQYTFIR